MPSNEEHRIDDRPAEEDLPAESLSVDQLTHAFAQLMGEERTSESKPAAPEPSPDSLLEPDEEDDSNVTPESILEAILFVGHPLNEPLTSRMMASYLRGVSPTEVDQLIEHLNRSYREDDAPYEIVSEGPGYRLTLRSEFESVRDMFYERIREVRLSQVAIDLLAIVAYNQPISRQEIDAMRGRPSGAVLSQLVRRQLLVVQREPKTPKKILYTTGDRFLDLFGLQSLDDLPRHEDFQPG
jgi:segregation and condensation protein B